jgi:transcriptional regulator with XRE-family HTH domain
MRAAWTPLLDRSGRPPLFRPLSQCLLIATASKPRDNVQEPELNPMTPKHTQFGKFLARQRKAAGLSMDALAEQIGASKSSIHHWEAGDWLPEIGLLEPLAQALSTSYEELFVKAGYDRETLPSPQPYFRLILPGASDRQIRGVMEQVEKIEASERRKKGRRE